MKKLFLISIPLVILAMSCGTKDRKDLTLDYYYDLEIVDSLTIDYLGNIYLLSVDAENDHFLFAGDDNQSHLMLVNRAGEFIAEFKKPSDAPDAFGKIITGSTFITDQIAVLGVSVFNLYDREFNLIKKFKKPYPHKGMIYMSFDHLQVGEKNGKPVLITFTGGPQTENPANSKAYYEQYNTLDLIDYEAETFTPLIPFHPNSRYAKGEEAFNFIKPHFQVDRNMVSFVHQRDSLFYQFDLDNEDFKSEKIPFDKFLTNSGFPIGGQEDYETPKNRPGEISQFFKVGNQHLIMYRSGLRLDELPGPEMSNEDRWTETLRLDKEKLIVRESDGSYSQPFAITKPFRLSRVDSKGRIWAHQNTNQMDYEPDMITLYELKLLKKQIE